jgi:hypothetical protein
MSPTHGEKPKKLPIPVKLAVGAIAGAFGTTCIFPIDMVKTRLQTSGTGPISIIKNIYLKEGGIRAFYKGLGPNLVGVVPEKSIKLVSFHARIIRFFFFILRLLSIRRPLMRFFASFSRSLMVRLKSYMKLFRVLELVSSKVMNDKTSMLASICNGASQSHKFDLFYSVAIFYTLA